MKNVILSFDDSRMDFYINVFPLSKKYNVPATLNVISDFVENPSNYSFPSGGNMAMSVAQVKECEESGLVEISCHGHTHKNTKEDVIANIEAFKRWGIDTKGIGFASPTSYITLRNKNEKGVWELINDNTISYVRSGIQIRREGLAYTFLSLMDRYLHSKMLFKILNNRTVVRKPERFLLSTAIFSYTRLGQIKCLINSIKDNSAVILMFHSVVKKGQTGYGCDRFYYDYNTFNELLNWLVNQKSARVCTTKQYINDIINN